MTYLKNGRVWRKTRRVGPCRFELELVKPRPTRVVYAIVFLPSDDRPRFSREVPMVTYHNLLDMAGSKTVGADGHEYTIGTDQYISVDRMGPGTTIEATDLDLCLYFERVKMLTRLPPIEA